MAKIKSKGVGIYVNEGTSETPDWFLIGCSTSDGFSMSTEAVETSSKCDGNWSSSLPGKVSWSFSNESIAEVDPSDAQMYSYNDVFDLSVEQAVKEWKIESTDFATDGYLRQGEGWISSLSDTATEGEYVTFNIEITGVGEVIRELP